MPSGAPASTAASATIFAALMVLSRARGCGLMMMPLRVFSEISVSPKIDHYVEVVG
jgi:hypothetical protein